MSLQFIDQSAMGIGTSDRRIIRSHVMRGKNAGRPRPSTRKPRGTAQPQPKKATIRMPPSPPSTGAGTSSPGSTRSLSIPRQVFWNDLTLTAFPQEMDPESTRLMHRWFFDISDSLFPPQFCHKFDIIKSIWVNCILADEAYFHSTLAISASYVHFYERRPRISSHTLHHISKAYALVNVKLSSAQRVSDSAIAAVISLAIYQQIHHQHSTGLLHLSGLYRMVQLRGGIVRLMLENRPLALKPLRLDVELAMQNGTPPLFPSDSVPVSAVLCDMHRSQADADFAVLSTLPPTMLDMVAFSRLLNDIEDEKQPKLNPLDFTETLIALLYRLMDVAPLRQPLPADSGGLMGDTAHLALLAFMTTLLPEYTRDQSNCPLLSVRLERAVQDCLISVVDVATDETKNTLLLWALFIGGISVFSLENHTWLPFSILEICDRMGLTEWPAVHRKLCDCPWIHSLHDAPARALWEAVRCKGMEISQSIH